MALAPPGLPCMCGSLCPRASTSRLLPSSRPGGPPAANGVAGAPPAGANLSVPRRLSAVSSRGQAPSRSLSAHCPRGALTSTLPASSLKDSAACPSLVPSWGQWHFPFQACGPVPQTLPLEGGLCSCAIHQGPMGTPLCSLQSPRAARGGRGVKSHPARSNS